MKFHGSISSVFFRHNLHVSKNHLNQRPSSMVSETSTAVTTSTVDTKPISKVSLISSLLKDELSLSRTELELISFPMKGVISCNVNYIPLICVFLYRKVLLAY